MEEKESRIEGARELLSALKRESPLFHGREAAGTRNFAIGIDVLEWMIDNSAVGGSSLETGCGYSTVVLGALSSRHTVLSPFPQEHEAIRSWAERHSRDLNHVTFIARASQEIVHSLGDDRLDTVLIDGDHAFPSPFIDWYYTADRVAPHGFVIVDDTQLKTGELLRDFLETETERWKKAADFGKTSIFQRITEAPVAKGVFWTQQPFCSDRN